MSATLELCQQLIEQQSVTPEDANCQQIMADRLSAIGFDIENLPFEDVKNLWARKGNSGPLVVFAGHTDVVPAGNEKDWTYPPFKATLADNGYLYGRGAADMKGSLAAMVTATENFVQAYPDFKGSIAFLITSDEEGIAKNGTVKVVETLEARQEKIDYCIVGEPSSTDKLGDIIKNGRRGSLSAKLTITGQQGHVAYPHLASNAIHNAAPFIDQITQQVWDQGNDYFPPTTFQISNIHAGTGANNVIPGKIVIDCNFRFSTEMTVEILQERFEALLKQLNIDYEVDWHLSGQPFITEKGKLVNAASEAIHQVMGYETELSTAGGTSDGRFIAPTGAQVVELGPVNATIHQVDECVKIDDLDKLSEIYQQTLTNLLT